MWELIYSTSLWKTLASIKKTTEDSEKNELKDGAFDKWMAFLLIHNSDQSKYGSLLNRLVSQFSMDNNQYPKNIMHATDILSNHKHDCRGNRGNQGNQQ